MVQSTILPNILQNLWRLLEEQVNRNDSQLSNLRGTRDGRGTSKLCKHHPLVYAFSDTMHFCCYSCKRWANEILLYTLHGSNFLSIVCIVVFLYLSDYCTNIIKNYFIVSSMFNIFNEVVRNSYVLLQILQCKTIT